MNEVNGQPWTQHRRVSTLLQGGVPDRLPFVTRLEAWFTGRSRTHTLPEEFAGLSLAEVHQAVGVGQLKFIDLYAYKLRGVEVRARLEGETTYQEFEPILAGFPTMDDLVSGEKPGKTTVEISTPVGKLQVMQELLPENVASGMVAYVREHAIKETADYKTVEYIIEHAEFVPLFTGYDSEQAAIGEAGWAVPMLLRIPFQQALLDYFGGTRLFYELYDNPGPLERLLGILDEQMQETLSQMVGFEALYVEFPDNLDGKMTNPRLFTRYCLPAYQRYTTILHHQGKKVGSHTDGNLRPLLALLAQSGLDVCESFSPDPLTGCTFAEAWSAWRNGPLIWGGIPSPILEQRTDREMFTGYIQELLSLIDGYPVIFGIVDLMLPHNDIERVSYIAHEVERYLPQEAVDIQPGI